MSLPDAYGRTTQRLVLPPMTKSAMGHHRMTRRAAVAVRIGAAPLAENRRLHAKTAVRTRLFAAPSSEKASSNASVQRLNPEKIVPERVRRRADTVRTGHRRQSLTWCRDNPADQCGGCPWHCTRFPCTADGRRSVKDVGKPQPPPRLDGLYLLI